MDRLGKNNSPRLDELLTKLLRSFGLPQAGESPVHSLVEAPGLENGQVLLVELLQEEPRRPYCPLQSRGKDDVNLVSTLEEKAWAQRINEE